MGQTIFELYDRVKGFDLQEEINKLIKENEPEIVDANTSQLMNGIKSTGESLGKYKSKSYEDYKLTKNPKGVVDLRNEGDFHTGFFIDDKPTGTFTYYHENGKIKSVLNYDDAGSATAELFWNNGKMAAKGFYDENRERHKTWMLYYEDGIMSAIINYSHGKANGRVQMFYPGSGKMVLDCVYKNGKLDGQYKKFFENGL